MAAPITVVSFYFSLSVSYTVVKDSAALHSTDEKAF